MRVETFGSLAGPGTLAQPTRRSFSFACDSIPLLEFHPQAFKRYAGDSELLWIKVNQPLLYHLTSQQITLFLDGAISEETARLWRESLLKEEAKEARTKGGFLKEIELPVKLPGLLGGGKAGLKVSGRQKISLGGESSYQVGDVTDINRKNSKFPQLQMEQQLRVSLKGNVGNKISVLVDHDSGRQLDARNKIRIRYEGSEDEIIQEIEAGNTSLSLGSGPEFITPSFSHQGLFGIRSTGRIGPATLTVIASKEESQVQTTSFVGQAKLDTIQISDTRYVHNQYFSVVMDPGSESYYYDPNDSVTSISVYIDDQYQEPGDDETGFKAICFLDPDNPDEREAHRGVFRILTRGEDQEYNFTGGTGILELKQAIQENHILAVSYESNVHGSVGGYAMGDSIVLKLIKPANVSPESDTWTYELRNVYYLGSRSIDSERFRLKIKRRVPSGEDVAEPGGVTYLNRLRLDTDDDGLIDGGHSRIDFEKGLLFFPFAEPFNTAYYDGSAVLDTLNAVIYSERYSRLKPEDNLYYLEASYELLQSTYNLSPLMVPKSEVVKVNGAKMVRGKDYDIEFFELRFKPGVVAGPDDRINVSYEVRPLFASSQKTLLGARAELPMGRNTKLGATWMYQGEGSSKTTLYPRFGEEPRRAMAADLDGRLEFRPAWMTNLVNFLPFVTTAAPSIVTASAEVAYSVPNPNIRGSAYIDDMEGTRVANSFSLMYSGWGLGSLPHGMQPSLQDTSFYWYNFSSDDPNKMTRGDVYPDSLLSESREREETMEVLNLRIYPRQDNPTGTWTSIQTLVQAGGADMVEREFLEVLVRGDSGILHVDLGAVSEDQVRGAVDPNNTLDTEDQNPRDGSFIVRDEDTGFDGVDSDKEPGYDQETNPDPSGDDFGYENNDPTNYVHVNGTEGNDRKDTEDLDGNGQLDTSEGFFSFAVPLAGQSEYVEGEYLNDWRLYRIPLESFDYEMGSADLSNIEYCRLWISDLGAEEEILVQVAGVEVVGSSWLSEGIQAQGAAGSDEKFRVKVRNNKEDPEYAPPYDPGEDERTGYVRREQSLVLSFENLGAGHFGSAYQGFYRDQDYSGYQGIAFWVKPFMVFDQMGRRVEPIIWVRLGANENNYYEIRLRAESEEWTKVEIDIEELTRTKVDGSIITQDGMMLSVEGAPSVTKIRRMTAGVENPTGRPATGEVWIDDIHLVRVRRERGFARRTSMKIQFADFASVDADYRNLDATYQRLDKRGSTGATSSTTRSRISTNISLDQFFPDRWGVKLPVSLLWSQSLSRPRLATGSDVILTEEERKEEESLDKQNRFSANLSKSKQSRNPIIRTTLDRLRLSYSRSLTQKHGPTRADTTMKHTASLDWSWAPGRKKSVKAPFGLELFYLPTNLSFGLTGQQTDPDAYVVQGDTMIESPVRFTRTLAENASFGFQPLKALTASYTFNALRDLTYLADTVGKDLLDDDLGNSGRVLPFWRALEAREKSRTQKVNLQFKLRLSSWLDPTLSYDTAYGENHDPALAAAADSTNVRDVSSSTSKKLRVTFSISQLFSKLSKRGDETSDFFNGLAKLAGKFQAIQGSIGETESSRYRGLYGRPGLSYQLGLNSSQEGFNPYDVSSKSSWDLSGGVQLIKDLRLSAKTSSSHDRHFFSDRETGSSSSTFPDLDLSWSGFHKIWLFRGRVTSSTVRGAYRLTTGERGAYEDGLFVKSGTSRKEAFSPRLSVSLRWKNGLTVSLGDNYSKDVSEDLLQAQATQNVRTSHSNNLSVQYAFSAPKGFTLPVFGKMQFKSDLRLSIELSKDHTLDMVGSTLRSDTSKWSVRPGISYDFGVVDSGVQLWVSETNNKRLDQQRRNVGLRVWVDFPF